MTDLHAWAARRAQPQLEPQATATAGATTSASSSANEQSTSSSALIQHAYAHIPFCVRKCPYCDFNAHAGRDDLIDAYGEALIKEARAFAPYARPRTLFVGGGTPTHGTAAQVERTLTGLRDALDLSELEEWTVEANPGSVDLAKVRALVRMGVTRVSMGAQTFHDGVLETLGRAHTSADIVRSAEILRQGGIERISLDLILAVPGQTLADQGRDVARALDLDPEHVSAYVLTFEEGTAFMRALREGRLPAPRPERELAHLHLVRDRLADAGLARYEISNFSRPGRPSLHNMAYWRNTNWLGLGAGAHAHVNGVRWRGAADPAAYIQAVQSDQAPEVWHEVVPRGSRALEHLLMGLRLVEGVDLAWVQARTGVDLRLAYAAVLDEALSLKLLVDDDTHWRPTSRGLDLLNALLVRFATATPDA